MMRAREIFEDTRPLYGDFRQLMDYAKSIGVVLDVSCEDNGDTINLLGLYRTKGNKGAGAEIMDRLCSLADQHNREIQLDAEGGSEGLFEYYARWGFELEQHVMDEMNDNPSYAGPWIMYRLPRTPINEERKETQPVVYHSTDWAPEIISSGVIRGKTLEMPDYVKGARGQIGMTGIHVTRSLWFAKAYATVIFALDWTKLKHRYRMIQRAEGAYDEAHPHGDYRLEAEEFIVAPEIQLDRYLLGIWMSEERRGDEEFSKITKHPLFRGWYHPI